MEHTTSDRKQLQEKRFQVRRLQVEVAAQLLAADRLGTEPRVIGAVKADLMETAKDHIRAALIVADLLLDEAGLYDDE
jgi:hypothetical protein